MRKGGGERSCVRKSAKVGSIRAERNSSKAGSLNGEGEGAGRKVRWSTGSRTIWADSFYGRPQRCCRDRQIGQPKPGKACLGWKVEGVASAGVGRGSGALEAMEGKSHVKISQPEYRCPHLVVRSSKRENKVGRGRKASAKN